jgi:hypothetical protein
VIEERHLETVDQHGAATPITLQIDASSASAVRITAETATETIGRATGVDLFESLTDMRRQLETHGLRLCCQAARINVWPSGQPRQFTNGEQGYVLTDTRPTNPDEPFEVVNLLDPAPADQTAQWTSNTNTSAHSTGSHQSSRHPKPQQHPQEAQYESTVVSDVDAVEAPRCRCRRAKLNITSRSQLASRIDTA